MEVNPKDPSIVVPDTNSNIEHMSDPGKNNHQDAESKTQKGTKDKCSMQEDKPDNDARDVGPDHEDSVEKIKGAESNADHQDESDDSLLAGEGQSAKSNNGATAQEPGDQGSTEENLEAELQKDTSSDKSSMPEDKPVTDARDIGPETKNLKDLSNSVEKMKGAESNADQSEDALLAGGGQSAKNNSGATAQEPGDQDSTQKNLELETQKDANDKSSMLVGKDPCGVGSDTKNLEKDVQHISMPGENIKDRSTTDHSADQPNKDDDPLLAVDGQSANNKNRNGEEVSSLSIHIKFNYEINFLFKQLSILLPMEQRAEENLFAGTTSKGKDKKKKNTKNAPSSAIIKTRYVC